MQRQDAIEPGEYHRLATAEGMCQCAAIDILQLAAQRHAVREARGSRAARTRQLCQVVRGRLAFHRGTGGNDNPWIFALGQTIG